jgi:hypothetical protein
MAQVNMKKKAKFTLKEAFSNYYEFSGLLSSNVRNLCYAGIAVIWVFKTGINPAIELPPALIFALLFFVASLLMDIFQYAWATIWWGKTSYSNEKLNKIKFLEPRWKSVIAECFFALKQRLYWSGI